MLRENEARYPHLRVLPFRRNGGSGTARRIGTQQARGEIVVWTDADMTYENERIPELVRMLRDDASYDQVVGARTTEEGTHKWARVPAKWLIRKIAEWLTNQRIPDLNSGLRAFRRDVSLPYLRLLPAGFSCVTTITIAFRQQPARHQVRRDELRQAGRGQQVPLRQRRLPLHPPGAADGHVLRPAQGADAAGAVDDRDRRWSRRVVDMVRHPFYFPASTVLLMRQRHHDRHDGAALRPRGAFPR